jgi:hypothetical protein
LIDLLAKGEHGLETSAIPDAGDVLQGAGASGLRRVRQIVWRFHWVVLNNSGNIPSGIVTKPPKPGFVGFGSNHLVGYQDFWLGRDVLIVSVYSDLSATRKIFNTKLINIKNNFKKPINICGKTSIIYST